MRKDIVESYGGLEDIDRSFDVEFYQAQPPKARFDATWDMIVHKDLLDVEAPLRGR